MNREFWDKCCERGILYLVLAILVFGPLAMGAVSTWELLVIQALTLGVVALWALRLWVSPRPQLLWPPLCWVVVAFVGYAIIRYTTADIEYVARQELIRILIYAVLFFAILNNLHRQESMQIIGYSMIFLAMAISFYAVYQFLTGSNRAWGFEYPYKGRGSGTYYSPNNLAGFLELLLPLGLAYTVIGRAKPVTKVFLGYAALAVVAGVGVTVSRGSWVACGLALFLFFALLALQRNYRLPALVLMFVLVAGSTFFVARTDFFKQRFKRAFVSGHVELDVRYDLWKATVQMWRDHVWWGVGPGHFDYRFRLYRPVSVQLRPDRAHNEYLNTLADWGVTGTAMVASAFVILFWGACKTWLRVRRSDNVLAGRPTSNKAAFVLGAALGLVAMLAHETVDFNMQIPANAILAVCLMALLTGCLRFASDRYWLTARLGVKLGMTLLLAAAFGYLGWQGWRRTNEFVWLHRAERLQNSPPVEPIALAATLEKAFVVEPKNADTAWAIGEAYRIQSWEGGENYADLAASAMKWFDRSRQLNRFDGYSFLRYGMCLDWIGRHDEAEPYFREADALDPNGYFTAAWIGWHYVEVSDYAAAKTWFERSLRLQWKDNTIAAQYLPIVVRRIVEGAAGPALLPEGAPPG